MSFYFLVLLRISMARILSKSKIGNKLIVKFDEKLQFNPGNIIDVI